MKRILSNNNVMVSGKLVSEFKYSHETFGEKFYIAQLSVERLSGTSDILIITVSERLVDVSAEWSGQYVKILGQFRSYNNRSCENGSLILSVFAIEFDVLDENPFLKFENNIILDGYICKAPKYRETPYGREITEIFLAVNRMYGKSDYIPCIVWGRNAVFASGLDVGTHIKVEGRLQSREYIKRFEDGTQELRNAYEASIGKLEVLEETRNESNNDG